MLKCKIRESLFLSYANSMMVEVFSLQIIKQISSNVVFFI